MSLIEKGKLVLKATYKLIFQFQTIVTITMENPNLVETNLE